MSDPDLARHGFLGTAVAAGAALSLPAAPASADAPADAVRGRPPVVRDLTRTDGQWAASSRTRTCCGSGCRGPGRRARSWVTGGSARSCTCPRDGRGVRFEVQHSEVQDHVHYAFPSYADGALDNVTAKRQTIPVPPGRCGKVRVLGACSYGALKTTLTATYTDGSTREVELAMSDWAGTAPAGGSEVVRCTHRHGRNGPDTLQVGLYQVPVTVDQNRELRSLTLPDTTKPALHVFALSVEEPR